MEPFRRVQQLGMRMVYPSILPPALPAPEECIHGNEKKGAKYSQESSGGPLATESVSCPVVFEGAEAN